MQNEKMTLNAYVKVVYVLVSAWMDPKCAEIRVRRCD